MAIADKEPTSHGERPRDANDEPSDGVVAANASLAVMGSASVVAFPLFSVLFSVSVGFFFIREIVEKRGCCTGAAWAANEISASEELDDADADDDTRRRLEGRASSSISSPLSSLDDSLGVEE